MKSFDSLKKKTRNYMFDHPKLRFCTKNSYMLIVTALSALIFTFGFSCFIAPNYSQFGDVVSDTSIKQLASSGASGISQVLVMILQLCNVTWLADPQNQLILKYVFYTVVNIPLCIMAWLKIGKKFTIYTILNVVLVTVFGIVLPLNPTISNFFNDVGKSMFGQPVGRVLFAGACTGISSALAYSIESTSGGIDIIAYYISERRSSPVGKFSAFLNAIVVTCFTIFSIIPGGKAANKEIVEFSSAIVVLMYTFLYMIITTLVIDTLNTQNKKESLQIITSNVNLSQVVLANVPHGCTIIEGYGGYTGKKLYIINMSVRKNEAKRVVATCRRVDPDCFINVIPMDQVYGKFYRKPIE